MDDVEKNLAEGIERVKEHMESAITADTPKKPPEQVISSALKQREIREALASGLLDGEAKMELLKNALENNNGDIFEAIAGDPFRMVRKTPLVAPGLFNDYHKLFQYNQRKRILKAIKANDYESQLKNVENMLSAVKFVRRLVDGKLSKYKTGMPSGSLVSLL